MQFFTGIAVRRCGQVRWDQGFRPGYGRFCGVRMQPMPMGDTVSVPNLRGSMEIPPYYICVFSTLDGQGQTRFFGAETAPSFVFSLTGVSPPASSASPDTISAPEKLRRTFQRAKIGAGEEEDDGGLAPT